MRACYVFDIDGTLANIEHRLPHIKKAPKDWDAFFAAAGDDSPIEHMRPVLHAMALVGYIVFSSGRPERTRAATADWLSKHKYHLGVFAPRLYMRRDGDHRPDYQVKREMLAAIRADGFDPVMAFDDRNQVVEMWRANGIPCAQVAPGDF